MKKHIQLKQQFYIHLGQQLQAARLTQGLTLEQVSAYTGQTTERLQKMENGEAKYLGGLKIGVLLGWFLVYGKNLRLTWNNLSLRDKPRSLSSYTVAELRQIIDERVKE